MTATSTNSQGDTFQTYTGNFFIQNFLLVQDPITLINHYTKLTFQHAVTLGPTPTLITFTPIDMELLSCDSRAISKDTFIDFDTPLFYKKNTFPEAQFSELLQE